MKETSFGNDKHASFSFPMETSFEEVQTKEIFSSHPKD
jgi:hypothetical protein